MVEKKKEKEKEKEKEEENKKEDTTRLLHATHQGSARKDKIRRRAQALFDRHPPLRGLSWSTHTSSTQPDLSPSLTFLGTDGAWDYPDSIVTNHGGGCLVACTGPFFT